MVSGLTSRFFLSKTAQLKFASSIAPDIVKNDAALQTGSAVMRRDFSPDLFEAGVQKACVNKAEPKALNGDCGGLSKKFDTGEPGKGRTHINAM